MDGFQFDAWTRRVMSGRQGRRTALKTALAAAAAGLVGHAAGDEVAAAPRCPGRTGCGAECRETNRDCRCIRKANGDRVCVRPCCSDRACDRDGDCRDTEVCMRTNCCDVSGRVCVTKCTEPRPAYCDVTAGTAGADAAETPGAVWGTTAAE